MDASVLDYEPHSALFVPDSDPLLFYRRIAELRLAPHLYFELNEAYAMQTADMFQSLCYHDIILKNDSYGKPRILVARTDLPAETYCARAEHCASEVRTKILAWGGTPAQADSVIDHLYEQGYLDDVRYCRAYTHDKLLYQHWGKVKILAMLQSRQLPSNEIQSALQNIDGPSISHLLAASSTKKNAPREAQSASSSNAFRYATISVHGGF